MIAELVCTLIAQGDINAVAMKALDSLKDDREYAGAILQEKDGQYCITNLAIGTEDNFAFKVTLRAGERLAGIFHNHIGNSDGRRFSHADVVVAKSLKVKSYISYQGITRVFDPETMPTTMHMSNGMLGASVAEGEALPFSEVIIS